MDDSREEKCGKEFEVGRECSFWELQDARKKICMACEHLAKHLVPNATVGFCEYCPSKSEDIGTYPQHFRTV